MEIKYSKRKIINWQAAQLWPMRKTLYHHRLTNKQHLLVKFVLLFLFSIIISTVRSQEKNLDDFVNAALQNSPLLKDYNNLVLLNLIDSARIIAGNKPQINGKSINLYAPVVNGWGYDEAITNIGNLL